ncbi:ribokinase [Aureibacillus halotolerans]|uniref:Ribokinase n=1 Tax=Aureibacillus halotolerans TaxID=1508390 RepID=A0A4R6U5J0_9BACI|nr:ribokinase [Aureibacillus halotolerans]TDQ41016.1 ribokinase [Aureibacillus halotolerans]
MKRPIITVVGSINMDLVTESETFPKPGETLLGRHFSTFPGGKGANQAVAAARLGAEVRMIGCVGDDAFGKELTDTIANEQIDTDAILVQAEKTGIASICLAEGDNQIIVVPGANHALLPEHIKAHEDLIRTSDLVLVQLEIPAQTVDAAVETAHTYGVPVIVNPAPIQALSSTIRSFATYLTPNEHEAAVLKKEHNDEELHKKCIVTQGKEGVSYPAANGQQSEIPGFSVDAIDTTGAGDTFNGALAVALGHGSPLDEACVFASAAAALAVTKKGAQTGMPHLNDVTRFLKDNGTSVSFLS